MASAPPHHQRQRPQFIAKDFKEFVRIAGLTQVKTSPYYPQSNGKIERWHKSLKADCIRPGTPLDIDQARRLIAGFVEHYNTVRLHSAIGYITPHDKLLGKDKAIFATRDQKLASARLQRKINRQNQTAHSVTHTTVFFQLTLNQYTRNASSHSLLMPRSTPTNAQTKSFKWKSNAKIPRKTLPLAKSPTTSSNNPNIIQPYAHLLPQRSLTSISPCEQPEKSLQITPLNSKAEHTK